MKYIIKPPSIAIFIFSQKYSKPNPKSTTFKNNSLYLRINNSYYE